MKRIITIIIVLVSFGAFAQKEVAKKVNELRSQQVVFKPYSVLTASNNIADNQTRQAIDRATFAKIKMQTVADLVANKDEYIEVAIPYQGKTIETQLYRVNIFAEGFHVDTDKGRAISYDKGVYYRGIVKGDSNSVVSFNFFKNELNGVISSQQLNNLVIGKLDKKNNLSDYIIYSDADLKVNNSFECKTKDVVTTTPSENRNPGQTSSTRCVTMYFEIDNDLYNANGSDTTTTTNWLTSVFNNVQTLYNNDGITVSLKSLYIWTALDPYEGIGTSSSDYLYKFNEVRPVFDGDLGQLLGIDPGGLGGVAVGIQGICTQQNFSYSDVNFSYSTVPTFSWTIMVITHEMGHLLGSPHTHACSWNGNHTAIDGCGPTANSAYAEGSCAIGPIPSSTEKGTIMSYCHLINGVGINLANGFGPQPAALILAWVNAGPCLSTDCINTCINAISDITVTNTTTSSATVTWTELGGATTWQISITDMNSPTTWVDTNTNSYTFSGLSPNTYYIFRVRPHCGFGLTSGDSNAIIVTSANYCNGIQITDTGGVGIQYNNNETYVRTIIPNLPNKKIAVTFSAFDLELNYDYLYVYDGNSTSANDLSAGGFTGTDIPGPFVSTATDGSLTIKFYSDGGVVADGYIADVACETLLATTSFEPNIDFTYFPNPTNGSVAIASKTTISEVLVYNLEGRLLYQNKINGLNAKVDMTAFATGTYFFKLKFNDKEANFKILKMN
jgi:hypothetical protein